MNKIFVTGDVHGDVMSRLSNKNFKLAKELDRTDLVFIAGDFGHIFTEETKEERYALNWLNNRPFTTMIVGGNHENWDRLRDLPKVEKFGVTLQEIRPNVFFVPNGTLIEYAGKRIFCMGGAMSTDKAWRIDHQRDTGKQIWWEGEIPTYDEMDFGTKNLEAVDYVVDVVISHTMPIKSVAMFNLEEQGYLSERQTDPTANYLSFIQEHTKFDKWYCGHFHVNKTYGYVTCLYEDIVDIDLDEYYSYGLSIPWWEK